MPTVLRPTSAIVAAGAVLASLVVGTAPAQAERPGRPAGPVGVAEWLSGPGERLPAGTWAAVEVAGDATYGLTRDGRVVSAVSTGKETLRAPTFAKPVTDVAAGSDFGLALDEDGRLHRWGTATWTIPAAQASATYRDVAAAGDMALGVTTDGVLRSWGPGAGGLRPADLLRLVGLDLAAVGTDGLGAALLTTSGRLVSLGAALDGVLPGTRALPLSAAGERFTALDVTGGTAVALTEAGQVVAWGRNGAGQADVPQLPAGVKAVAVSTAGAVSGAVLDDGSLVRWGDQDALPTFSVPDGARLLDLDLDPLRAAVTYAAMAAQGPVTLSGTPTVGVPLTAEVGWVERPTDVTHTWRVDGEVRGTEASYTPTGRDAGRELAVTVRGTRLGLAPGEATSAPEQVRPGALDAPLVRVQGTPRVGSALTARVADDADATGGGYRWLHDGTAIAGATRSRYTPVAADLGRRLSVVRTSTAPGYDDAESTSPATSPVGLGAARLRVAAPARAVRGRALGVVVRGLARGERFTVSLGPRTVRGTATGRAQRVRVPVAVRPGVRRLTVVGGYADRRGADTVRVVRPRRR